LISVAAPAAAGELVAEGSESSQSRMSPRFAQTSTSPCSFLRISFLVLVGHLGWLARLDLRFRTLLGRLLPDGAPVGSGGLRERAVAAIAGGGAAAKAAATVATVVVVGGAIGATHVLDHGSGTHRHHRGEQHRAAVQRASAPASPVTAPPIVNAATVTEPRTSSGAHRKRAPSSRRSVANGKTTRASESSAPHEPAGFAYLGVPSATQPASTSASAHVASSGGGQFSP